MALPISSTNLPQLPLNFSEPKCLPTFHPLELELCIKPDMNPLSDKFGYTESKLDGHIVLIQVFSLLQTQLPPGPAKAAPVLVPRQPVPAQPWPGSIQAITALWAPLTHHKQIKLGSPWHPQPGHSLASSWGTSNIFLVSFSLFPLEVAHLCHCPKFPHVSLNHHSLLDGRGA